MQYQLRVLQHGKPPIKIKMEATNTLDAKQQAEEKGYKVLSVKRPYNNLFKRQSKFPLTLFCQEFRVLMNAGLSINDVLETLIEKESNSNNKNALLQLLGQINEGQTLSAAMARNTAAFPSLLVATIRAAETTGNLPEALARYSHYLENIDLLKKRLISASVYPAIVLGFGILVLLFLLAFVIPKFTTIYETQVKSVSLSTQFLLSLGNFSETYGIYLLAGFILLILGIAYGIVKPEYREKLTELLWKTPYLGTRFRIYLLSRFYRTFSMLIKSGIPVVTGLEMVQNLLGSGLQKNLNMAKNLVKEGKPISEALAKSELTTPVAARLLKVGEKTGSLSLMMEQAAEFHEEEMARWIDHFTKIFEPTLMAIIGILIGGIVLMMYLPIFQLASGLG